MDEETDQRTTIAVYLPLRKRLQSFKRGDETYHELLEKMADQYDPDASHASDAGE